MKFEVIHKCRLNGNGLRCADYVRTAIDLPFEETLIELALEDYEELTNQQEQLIVKHRYFSWCTYFIDDSKQNGTKCRSTVKLRLMVCYKEI